MLGPITQVLITGRALHQANGSINKDVLCLALIANSGQHQKEQNRSVEAEPTSFVFHYYILKLCRGDEAVDLELRMSWSEVRQIISHRRSLGQRCKETVTKAAVPSVLLDSSRRRTHISS